MNTPRQWPVRLHGGGGGGNPANTPYLYFTGGDPTGVEESTADLQTAMDTAAATGKTLYLPPGQFTCGKLIVPSGLKMMGAHPGGYGIFIADDAKTLISAKAGLNDHLLFGDVDVAHVRLSYLHFDGNKNNNTTGCVIYLENSADTPEESQWHIRDCFIESSADHGIFVGQGRRANQISDCTINYCRTSAIRMAGSDGHIDRCIIGSNLETGIIVAGTVCNINDCDIYGNGTIGNSGVGDGIQISSTITMVTIVGNRIDQNKRNGILVSGSCSGISIVGNQLHGNSQNTDGNAHGVRVITTTGAVTIANNIMGVDGNVTNKEGYFIFFDSGATAQGSGNVIQANATKNGFTNVIPSFQQTRDTSKLGRWAPATAVAQSFDRNDAVIGNVTSNLTSGRLHVIGGFVVPAGTKVSAFNWLPGNASASGLTNQWAVLLDKDLNILATTADATTAGISTNTFKSYAFTTPYTAWTDMPMYVGLCIVATTTMPDFRGINGSSQPNAVAPISFGVANTGLTNPASLTSVTGLTGTTGMPYAYLS